MGVILYNNSVGLVYPLFYLLFYDVVGFYQTTANQTYLIDIFSWQTTTMIFFSYDTYIPDLNFLRFIIII